MFNFLKYLFKKPVYKAGNSKAVYMGNLKYDDGNYVSFYYIEEPNFQNKEEPFIKLLAISKEDNWNKSWSAYITDKLESPVLIQALAMYNQLQEK